MTGQTGRWISGAEVDEIPFTAFGSRTKADQVAGRLVVRRIPDLNASFHCAGHQACRDGRLN